jgi:hypothetical protein
MKTKSNKKQSSGLPSRPDEQLSQSTEQQKPARVLPFVNFSERDKNRALSTDQVLDLLRQFLPAQYDLAEVVGKWIWITFPEPPPEQVRGQLSQFGFHWNNTRKCWQHPCGALATEGSAADPREKYGSRFAADSNPFRYNGPPRTAEQVAA